ALGILDVVQQRKVSSEQIASAARYRELIAATGRFLTFSAGAATIGYRLRKDPGERAALRVVRETGAGLVLSGKVGMHTSPVYAEDVYIGAHSGVGADVDVLRSEEHTSELQSRGHLVCRLLLEKKKRHRQNTKVNGSEILIQEADERHQVKDVLRAVPVREFHGNDLHAEGKEQFGKFLNTSGIG